MKNAVQGYVPPSGYVPPTNMYKPLEEVTTPQEPQKQASMSVEGFKEYMADYAELDRVAKQIKEKQDAIKEVVLKGLKDLGLETAKTDYGTFTIVPENITERFDAKTFKEENPRIHNLYIKKGTIKEHLKVTPKKVKKES